MTPVIEIFFFASTDYSNKGQEVEVPDNVSQKKEPVCISFCLLYTWLFSLSLFFHSMRVAATTASSLYKQPIRVHFLSLSCFGLHTDVQQNALLFCGEYAQRSFFG